ncbi:MAG: hypothetical protein MUF40_01415 [Gemmatimonadaceae bacterium]|nr:hypothetical protein [Gemmatimonadaceae bacterium]
MLAVVALARPARTLAAQGTEPPLRIGVRVAPETVTVGRPFTVRVRVDASSRWRVMPPAPVDTGGDVEPLDPALLRDTVVGARRVTDVAWRFLAWRPGAHPIPVPELVVRDSGGAERRLPLRAAVAVRSLLPDDTAQRTPRPAREPIAPAVPWWPRVALVAGLVAALAIVWGAGRWLLARRRRRRAAAPATPHEVARAAFERLVARDLLAAGEGRRQVALAGEILRDFLGARLGLPPALATGETLLVAGPAVGAHAEALADLLGRIDRARFARAPLPPDEARAIVAEARRLVDVLDERARSPRATPLALERIG